MKKMLLVLSIITALMFVTAPGYADMRDMKTGIGMRAGLSLDPDQFVIGAQAMMGAVKGKIDFSPSLDFGTGDNLSLIAINLEGTLNLVSPPGAKFIFYLGGGPTAVFYSPDGGDSDSEVGLSLTGGIKIAAGQKNFYNVKAMIGLGDIPEIKILFGYMFGLGQKSGS